MTEVGRKYLSDILMAIERIETFIQDTPNFVSYEADIKKTFIKFERRSKR